MNFRVFMNVGGANKHNVACRNICSSSVGCMGGVSRQHNKHFAVVMRVLGKIFGAAVYDAVSDAGFRIHEAISA